MPVWSPTLLTISVHQHHQSLWPARCKSLYMRSKSAFSLQTIKVHTQEDMPTKSFLIARKEVHYSIHYSTQDAHICYTLSVLVHFQ